MHINQQKGLSILGLIIAIFITSVALVGILGLSEISFKVASISKTRLIASGLAQEGVEIIRAMRRSYNDWDTWYNLISGTDTYYLQHNSDCLTCCPPGTCPTSEVPLRFNQANGFYQYIGGGTQTNFYRKITLSKVSSDHIKVLVEIDWNFRGGDYSLIVEDHLWNWK